MLLITIIILIIFCVITVKYIYERIHNNNNEYNYNDIYDDDDDDEKNYNNIENLLLVKPNSKFNIKRSFINNKQNTSTICKGMAIEIDDDNQNCNAISQKVCDGDVNLKRITIPLDSNIDVYSHWGNKLTKGKSYCIYKPPPNIVSYNNTNKCDETWGFWQYSLTYERWLCKSKVPGIYNAQENIFDPCTKGELLYDDKIYDVNNIPINFIPENFYDNNFQRKFSCRCKKGYIFLPHISRTTCFKDPCLANLPPNVEDAEGYDVKTGNCRCGQYYKNLFHENFKSPCTACPVGAPTYDHTTNMLLIYIKCKRHNKDDGIFPCKTIEDKATGCIKGYVKVKPMKESSDNYSFKELVLF